MTGPTAPRAAIVVLRYGEVLERLGLPPDTKLLRVIDCGFTQAGRIVGFEIEAPYLPALWSADNLPSMTMDVVRAAHEDHEAKLAAAWDF